MDLVLRFPAIRSHRIFLLFENIDISGNASLFMTFTSLGRQSASDIFSSGAPEDAPKADKQAALSRIAVPSHGSTDTVEQATRTAVPAARQVRRVVAGDRIVGTAQGLSESRAHSTHLRLGGRGGLSSKQLSPGPRPLFDI